MLSETKFILRIKEHKILYSNNAIKPNETDALKKKKLWDDIAKDFKLADGNSAQLKWRELTQDYIKYLIDGNTNAFLHFNEMIFMQPHIMGLSDSPEHSDSDIDETELQRILYSDDECERPPPRTSPTRKRLKEQTDTVKPKRMSMEKNASIPTTLQCASSKEITTPQLNMERFSNGTSFNNLSSLELIFLGYAKVLQKMPLALQLQTKRKIAEIMDDAEMMMLEQ